MFDIILHKIDESFMGVECDPGIAMELRDRFSFFAENYKYHPKYKAKFWDGRIVLYRNNNTINVGLLSYFPDFCKERNYTLKIDPRLTTINEFSREDAEKFIDTLGIPFKVRDYQIDAFVKAIRYKRKILLSSTGSGKSLILYLIVRYLQETKQKGLIVVPTVSLTQQMYKDFISYGYDSSKYCHTIYSGQTKDADKFLYISTFQSLVTIKKGKYLDSSYFQQFDFLIIDECLHPKTKITMGDGNLKQIQEICVGDVIKTFNEETQCIENKQVKEVHKNISQNEKMYELQLDNGETLKITGNHKVLLSDGLWKRVDELKEGDVINSCS